MWWTEFHAAHLGRRQILAVDNLNYRFREPQRRRHRLYQGGIPSSPGLGWWGQRPGQADNRPARDTVFIENGQIFVNDVALTEDYVDCELVDSLGPITINEGELFVMGDNRRPGGSMDSRSFGPIPSSSVVGRAVFVVLPSPHKVD